MNTNNVCRACLLSSSEMFSLFSQLESLDSPTQLAEMLMACTTIQIAVSDGLPELLCRSCVIDLSNAYIFKLRCERTDTTLREYLKDNYKTLENISIDEKNFEEIVDAEDSNNFKIKLPNSSIKKTIDTTEVLVTCNKCNVGFCNSESLVEHLLSCETASITTSQNKENLKLEVLEVTELKSESVEYNEHLQDDEDGEVKIFFGDDKAFPEDSNDENEEEIVEDNSEIDKQETVLKEYYYKSADDKYICLECKASLSTIGNFRRHIKIHTKKTTNICLICNKSFARPDTLTEHIKRHTNSKQFECHICKKQYSTRGALSTHMYTHDKLEGKLPKERLHECSYCKKCFMSNSSLIIHIRTHTKEKPFLCQTCGKGFATRGGVDLHQRRHTGERPFKCEFCGRGFAESSNLKVHIRAHTGDRPHLCSLCGKRFTRMFLLQLHIRTHTGEKPYACSDCPKAFAQQGDLAAHKRTHTGQRPHKCPLCNQGFIKSSGLKKHVQSKHTKESIKLETGATTIAVKDSNSLILKNKIDEIQKEQD